MSPEGRLESVAVALGVAFGVPIPATTAAVRAQCARVLSEALGMTFPVENVAVDLLVIDVEPGGTGAPSDGDRG